MGVPAFFRWLSRKYPSVVVHCVEQKAVDVNGTRIPTDSSEPNPNGVEFDNLYLDLNGIIHPCTHPEDRPAPRNEDEMMVAIFDCIDRMFNIVRPRKLLYMAIDGVAPRAKMNQQRSRRFRATKEAAEKMNEIKRIRAELLLRGINLPEEKPKEEHFDSNCITPGTPFMARLSDCLHYYIHERLNNDPGWKNVKVILSDANVPGEGEHKIMDYIRKQRAQPDHDPNTQHCLCGADADLIMLGLATHEPNFTIIREEFKPNQPRPCEICAQIGHEMKDCVGGANSLDDSESQKIFSETDYIFVRLSVLKEYLERELQMPNLPFKYEFERVVDDWVFMCFFVGNDFLPHLPSLEIREGAIDRLVTLYKDCVYKTGGWLTNSGDVNLERVQLILNELGKSEDEIFKTRQQKELQFKAREKAKKRRMGGYNQFRPNWALVKDTQFAPTALGQSKPIANARQEAFNIRKAGMHSQGGSGGPNKALEAMMTPVGSNETAGESGGRDRGQKRKLDDGNESEDDQAHDEVRLWEDGFKDRYYESKFDVGPDNHDFRNRVALHYVRGLCWVLRYYYQGCASWKWFFPYHYAPFASDFVHISGLSTEFEPDTKPFQPLEQLMGVFPAGSSQHVPKPWAKLMSDPDSTIIDFYPEDFKIDLNGKKFAWQGVALLPFVEEQRLFDALKPYYSELSEAEIRRNTRGDDRLYVGCHNSGYTTLNELYVQKVEVESEVHVSIDGMQGLVMLSAQCVESGGFLDSPVTGLDGITDNSACCVRYRDPKYSRSFVFPAVKLKGAVDAPKVLKPGDLDHEQNRNWRTQVGMAPATNRASLGGAGHNMLGHYAGRNQRPYNQHQNRGGGQHNFRQNPGGGGRQGYGSVPPPGNFDRRNSNYNSNYQGSGSGHRGGYNSYSTGQQSHSRGGYNRNQGNQDGGYYQQGYSSQQPRGGGYNRGGGQRQDNNRGRPPGPYKDAYQANSTDNRYNNNYRR